MPQIPEVEFQQWVRRRESSGREGQGTTEFLKVQDLQLSAKNWWPPSPLGAGPGHDKACQKKLIRQLDSSRNVYVMLAWGLMPQLKE